MKEHTWNIASVPSVPLAVSEAGLGKHRDLGDHICEIFMICGCMNCSNYLVPRSVFPYYFDLFAVLCHIALFTAHFGNEIRIFFSIKSVFSVFFNFFLSSFFFFPSLQ